MSIHTYTIEGITYIPYNNSLFEQGERIKKIGGLTENQFYLHENQIGQFEVESLSYSAFDAIFTPRSSDHKNQKKYYTIEDQGNLGDQFTTAYELHRLIPDQLVECPGCGSPAGDKTDPETPKCLSCGHGIDT